MNVLAKQFSSPVLAEKRYQSLSQGTSVQVSPIVSQPLAILQMPNVPSQLPSQLPVPSIMLPTSSLPDVSNVQLASSMPSFPQLSSCSSASFVTQPSALTCTVVSTSSFSATPLSHSAPFQHNQPMTVGHVLSALLPVGTSAYPTFTGVTVPLATLSSTTLSTTSNSWNCTPPLCSQASQSNSTITVGQVLSEISSGSISKCKPGPKEIEKSCWEQLEMLSCDEQCAVLTNLFGMIMMRNTNAGCIPSDFLQLCLHAMAHLKQCDRTNVIYLLAKALGTMRSDQSDSLLPAKRMPMGLIEYIVQFFTSSSAKQVRTDLCHRNDDHLHCFR